MYIFLLHIDLLYEYIFCKYTCLFVNYFNVCENVAAMSNACSKKIFSLK